jgi:hypothetical protein
MTSAPASAQLRASTCTSVPIGPRPGQTSRLPTSTWPQVVELGETSAIVALGAIAGAVGRSEGELAADVAAVSACPGGVAEAHALSVAARTVRTVSTSGHFTGA